ncbi:glucan biosynthesis protein [Cupriavidus basilensis]
MRGFRVLYPINRARQARRDHRVCWAPAASGSSARARCTGLSGARPGHRYRRCPVAEEFPAFREFWIARPDPQDKHLVFYALLDSPRADRRLPLRPLPR